MTEHAQHMHSEETAQSVVDSIFFWKQMLKNFTTRKTLRFSGACLKKSSEAGEGSREQALREAAEGTGVV